MPRTLFYGLMAVAAVICFIGLVNAVRSGNVWLSVLLPVLISPGVMYLLRVVAEEGEPRGLLHPATQSWAFLFGDTIALPLAFAGAAFGWRRLETDQYPFFQMGWWLVIAIGVGLLIAWGWHNHLDAPNYIREGHADLLSSPTKLWHDYVVYPVLGAALVYVAVPIMLQDFKGAGWLVIAGLVLWAMLGVYDMTVHKPKPENLHPPVSRTILSR